MSKPIHNRGSAAEQGAAIRRQFEGQQQKRFSSQIQTDRLHHRETPPPASDDASAVRRSSTRRKRRTHKPAGDEESVGATSAEESRYRDSLRNNRDSIRKTSTIANEPPPPSRAAVTDKPREEEPETQRSKRGSRALRKKETEADVAAAPVAAVPPASRRGRDPEKAAAADEEPADEEPAEPADPEHDSKAKEAAGAGGLMAALGLGGWGAKKAQDDAEPAKKEKQPTEKVVEKPAKRSKSKKEKSKPVAAVPIGSEGRRRNYAKKDKAAAAAPVYDGDGQPSESAAEPVEQEEDEEDEEDESHAGTGALAAGGAAAAAGAGGAAAASHGERKSVPLEKKGRIYSLTGIDNLALMLEDAGYQTACFSVYLFKTKLDYDTVLNFFEKLAEAYPKYRYVCELNPSDATKKDKAARKGQATSTSSTSSSSPNPGRKTGYSKSLKAGGNFRPAKWRVDETFDVAQNIRVVKAQNDGSDDDLYDVCGDCLGTHFDFNKPLWEATVVHGLHTSGGARSALMIKIHHAFSDGQGMIQSYHSAIEAMSTGVTVESKQAEIDSQVARASAKQKKTTEEQVREKSDGEEQEKKIGSRNVKPTVGGTISHSWHTVRGLYFRKRKAFTYPDSAGKDAVRRYGAQLGKNERPSTRLYAHSDGISMSDIKLIRQAFSTDKVNLSLNDVACALLSRALRIAAETMASKHGQKVSDKRIAVFIPISKRPKGDWSLANYTTGAIAWFRFHEPSRYGFESLLMQVNREMNRIKRSKLPGIWYDVFGAFAKRRFFMMPNYPIARQIFQSAYREYNVFTNVPGPPKPVSFGKHEAFSYHVLPPSSPGKSTLAMGAISYAGEFSLAVSCDGVREFKEGNLPETICQAFQQASQELVRVAKEKMDA
ncbi:hypothetical protein BDZ90DRAFT_232855 [Jaminaea rosea]|uniref:Uncharacterized protein n=1 Tax=Jaminaea rosea TaxID=1569628 RepID=A0A316UPN2_9BASI|nr:hypothetical protein BDZ90DRAFT_232855 [Jaminaea rosea]PWN26738.1 hypothetical protein BDZ90DRAFT_232855 [Jaminaea rosea]